MTDVQLPCDLSHIDWFAFESEGGVARHNMQRRHFTQIGDDILADSIAEIFLLGIAAHIGKRPHTDREPFSHRLRFLGISRSPRRRYRSLTAFSAAQYSG